MILETMTKKEVRREMEIDRDRLDYMTSRQMDGIKNKLKQIRKRYPDGNYHLPVQTYKSPLTKNRWFLYNTVCDVEKFYGREKAMLVTNYVVKAIFDGEPVYITYHKRSVIPDGMIVVVTSHCLRRFNERCLKMPEGTDLQEIANKFFRSFHGIAIEKNSTWKHETDKMQGVTFNMDGGIILGMEKKDDPGYFIANTFVSMDLLGDNQKELGVDLHLAGAAAYVIEKTLTEAQALREAGFDV